MAATDADICNLALARIGQQQKVTSPVTSDTSGPGIVCGMFYPQHRDALLREFPWAFALRRIALYPTVPVDTSNVPGYLYSYGPLPSDFLAARYVYNGARPGSPATLVIPSNLLSMGQPGLVPTINGRAFEVSFEIFNKVVFTDWQEALPAWDSTETYTTGAVVTYGGGTFSAAQSSNLNNTPPAPGASNSYWTASTVTKQVQLIYSAQITDVTQYPADFVDVLAWKLAADLAMGVAQKPDFAQMILRPGGALEMAMDRALQAQGNARQPDIRPTSSFVAIRG